MMTEQQEKSQSFDFTPSWTETCVRCLVLLETNDPGMKKLAEGELYKMAKLADAYVQLIQNGTLRYEDDTTNKTADR
jgi:hypothetical protein